MRPLLTIILITSSSLLSAQQLPQFIQERMDFCNSNLTDEQAKQLKKELTDLEEYFVNKGLLSDKSGGSYRKVYEQIAKENDLRFEIDTSFNLLDNLNFKVYTGCFYKVLTPEQLSQLTYRHQIAAEQISASNDGNLTPGLVAQRIIENLTTSDFDLEFYKISSLLTFYKISSPKPKLSFNNLESNQEITDDLQTIEVILDAKNQISINNDILNLKEVEQEIYSFLKNEPNEKGVAINSSRSASYESFMELLKVINLIYSRLDGELNQVIKKNIIIGEPK